MFYCIIIMEQSKPILLKKNDEYFLKIDNGDHYYLGIVKQSDFPNDIKNYIEVVEKSLIGFTDSHEKILSSIITPCDENKILKYMIDYNISYGSFTRSFTVEIKMDFNQKEQMDYINERFALLETHIKLINDENSNLKKQIKEISNQLDDLRDSDQSSEILSDDDRPSVVPKAKPTNEPVVSKRRVRGTV